MIICLIFCYPVNQSIFVYSFTSCHVHILFTVIELQFVLSFNYHVVFYRVVMCHVVMCYVMLTSHAFSFSFILFSNRLSRIILYTNIKILVSFIIVFSCLVSPVIHKILPSSSLFDFMQLP